MCIFIYSQAVASGLAGVQEELVIWPVMSAVLSAVLRPTGEATVTRGFPGRRNKVSLFHRVLSNLTSL